MSFDTNLGRKKWLNSNFRIKNCCFYFHDFFYKLTLTPKVKLYYKKESVESSAYLSGGSGKPKEQINNTPHLYRYAHDSA